MMRVVRLQVVGLCLMFAVSAMVNTLQLQHQVCAQEQTQTADPPTVPAASLDDLVQSWKELDSDLADLELEFKAATDTEKQEDIRGRYKALVERAEEVVLKIRTEAIKSLESNSLDEKTSKLLVGLLMNDSEFQRYNDAIQLGDQLVAAGIDSKLLEQASKADRLSIVSKELIEELLIRQKQAKQDDLPRVKISTSKGDLVVELFEDEAPNTVASFVSLVEKKFYDGLTFHRVVEGFVAQGGDPNGDGSGGPGYTIKCECVSPEHRRHYRGSISMAHAGEDSGGSQFFICLDRATTAVLDGKHTVFGRVVDGMEVLDKLSRNYTTTRPIPNSETDTINSMTIERKRDHAYEPVTTPDEPDATEEPESTNDDATNQGSADAGSDSSGTDEESNESPDPAGTTEGGGG